jgi:putative PIN family toxin of toxin-antitoxin system
MKAVLDVNVLVSAAIHRLGKSRQVLTQAAALQFELLTCEHILVKAREVLARPHIQKKYQPWVTPAQQKEFFETLHQLALVVEVRSQVNVVGDQEDDVVLACALDGQADYLVTGDPDLLTLKEFRNIQIVPPAQFLKVLAELPAR